MSKNEELNRNHLKSTCRIGPFCWNMWVTEALSLLSASSILSSCFRQKSCQPFDFQSVAWVLNRSQIHNPGVYTFQSHWKENNKALQQYQVLWLWIFLVQITSSISMIFNIYDLQLPTISVPPFLPAFSWCQPRSRSEPRSCNARQIHLGPCHDTALGISWGCLGQAPGSFEISQTTKPKP